MRIILASNSPRRRELMDSLNIPYICIPPNIDESFSNNLCKENIVKELALRKANAVYKDNIEDFIIASDTIVYLEGEIINKPLDEKDAYIMLEKLSGKKHSVLTAVAFKSEKEEYVFLSETYVFFKDLSKLDIDDYLATKEYVDKAGGYGIQGEGKKLVTKYEGDYLTIVGFPLEIVKSELKKRGIL